MYGVDEITTDRLTDLAGKADQENIWEDFNDLLLPGFGSIWTSSRPPRRCTPMTRS